MTQQSDCTRIDSYGCDCIARGESTLCDECFAFAESQGIIFATEVIEGEHYASENLRHQHKFIPNIADSLDDERAEVR